jgi:hypothetical protein
MFVGTNNGAYLGYLNTQDDTPYWLKHLSAYLLTYAIPLFAIILDLLLY